MKKNFSTGIGLICILAELIFNFIKKVFQKGRVTEFFISVPALILIYWFMVLSNIDVHLLVWTIPAGAFAAYWWYLFSVEKITSPVANINWANRSWWWTLDGWEFEEEVAKVFRLNGYKAEVTKKTGDGGIDLILYKDKVKYIVQCKHYKNPVGPEPVRALWGVKDDFRADRVVMVASSGISGSSKDFISGKRAFEVYDLEDIISMGLRPTFDKLL